MKLRAWLDKNGIDNSVFGTAIGRSAEAVRRYAGGERIPDKETMPRIVAETKGQVTPNDFFDLATLPHCPLCDTSTPGDIAACTCVDCPAREREAA